MKNIAEILGWENLREKLYEDKQLEATIEETENNKIKINTRIFDRHYKFELTKNLWGSVEEVYETLIAAQMLIQGYLMITIDGGWLIINPKGEDYQIESSNCTCGDFLYNRKGKSRCKHLMFRDWHLNYRQRILKYKSQLNQPQ